MLLVDKEIKRYIVDENTLITEGYREENIGPISYDVTIDRIITKATGEKVDACDDFVLQPMNTVFIKTMEKISLPENMTARVVERNSIMRKGLFVSGPHYQPGHETRMFLRVKNFSDQDLRLIKGDRIAQLEFEKLNMAPEKPYSKQKDNNYQKEEDFRANGDIGDKREIWDIDSKIKELDKKELQIYTSLITLMGIFVAIFSLVITNISQYAKVEPAELLLLNSSLCAVLVFLTFLVMLIIGKINNTKIWYMMLAVSAVIFLICFFVVFLDKIIGEEEWRFILHQSLSKMKGAINS